MRTKSIKAKLYIVIAFITMILLIAVLNYCLNRIVHSSEHEYQNTIRLEKSFSDLISDETTSLYSPSSYENLKNKYSAFQKSLTNGLPALDNDSVAQRMRYLDELFRTNGESSSLYLEVRQNLIGLFDSVRYIHEHHIAYFKNLLRRGAVIQDYDIGESFQRSPIASANEVDIIKIAVAVQTSLFEIFQSFHDFQQDGDLSLVEKQFSARIKTFYDDVNTFEDYSLDAQDGLLVEELLFNGRAFEESFKNLVTIKTRKQAIIKKLNENKITLLNILGLSIKNISAKNQSIKRNIEVLQVISLITAVLMVLWIIHGGKRIIHETKRTVQETERIQRDLSYQIRIDENEFEEFRIVSQALNSMTKRINEHVAAIEKSNDELRVEVAERKKAEKMADSANQAKSEFLANMSHELRTPLNHIVGFTEILIDKHFGELNETQEEYLNDVLYSSKHLLALINDILDLSKVEAGKLQLDPIEVDLEKLLADSMTMFKEKAMNHRLQMKTTFENLPERIQADERSLKQILYNLLSNAVKFTPDGGKIRLRAIRTDNFNNGQKQPAVEISITDSGIGITPEDIGRIFKAFEQAETSSSRRYQGTGLGLSLTKHLIELHGGKIWATSGGRGKGSTFHFILPVQIGSEDQKKQSVIHESAPRQDPQLQA